MKHCTYFYCRSLLGPDNAACRHCGHPADEAMASDPAYLVALRRQVRVERIIDMHQILRSDVGELERQLETMQRLGVEKALLQSAPREFTGLLGNGRLEFVAREYRDRFWASYYVDPHAPTALDDLQFCTSNGIRVVKLVPSAGFAANDPALHPFWAAMEERQLVAMVHTGFVTARHKGVERRLGRFMDAQLSHPFLFDQPARRYPALQIILCHLGGISWYKEAAQMVSEHANVWGDTSAFGAFALRRCLAEQVPLALDKVFWGNDSSASAYLYNLRLLISALEANGLEAAAEALLYDNAKAFADRYLEK